MHIQPIDNDSDFEPFVRAMSPNVHHSTVPGEAGETFDDVWGSEPSSPTLPAGHGDGHGDGAPRSAAHPSDMARLQAEHSTAGYREGLTDSKSHSIQAGFDEGFGLGAAIGAKAGLILGVLEGIANALANTQDVSNHGGEEAQDEAAKTLGDAKKELDIGRVFGPEYWNPDGTWKYDVGAEDDDGDVLFAHVADAHPLIAKWSAVADAQVARWAIDRAVFADVADEERQHQHQLQQDKPGSAAAPQVKKPLDW
ncbi:essential protein Yae1 [Plectosphaerella plurivora]|uniref:Protein YAE1 n=1 Tax=Plectosphaerella plurivora TaxID=936078 RepID=A0A9P9A3A1_9PEZI|nr:essential protein Yae1 [Plectosphaerella plurivora]